jgi:hypothetical protein
MTWTIDLDAAWPATLAPVPDVLAAAVNEPLARPAAQQPPWPGPEEVARVRGVLENLEIVSPDDDTWKKLASYAAHEVDELLIVDPDKRRVDWLGLLAGARAAAPARPGSGRVGLGEARSAHVNWLSRSLVGPVPEISKAQRWRAIAPRGACAKYKR